MKDIIIATTIIGLLVLFCWHSLCVYIFAVIHLNGNGLAIVTGSRKK
jgi:hypothetical protein